MLEKYLKIETISIVFLGNFNPVIITPFWLFSKELIREEEAENATVGIMHNEIVQFGLDWVYIEITKDRCEFKTNKSPYFDIMKDLSISVFNILNETPIHSLGINHIYDIAMPNKDAYYEFGNTLSPLSYWEEQLKEPRLNQLEIVEEKRSDGLNGKYRVRITPTNNKKITYGVSFNINDHYVINADDIGTNMEMVKLLGEKWDSSSKRAKEIANSLLKVIKL